MQIRVPPRLKKFPVLRQRRLDELLDKNAEGTITPAERAKLEQLVAEAEQVMVDNAKRLAKSPLGDIVKSDAESVPVTVWVKPERAGG